MPYRIKRIYKQTEKQTSSWNIIFTDMETTEFTSYSLIEMSIENLEKPSGAGPLRRGESPEEFKIFNCQNGFQKLWILKFFNPHLC